MKYVGMRTRKCAPEDVRASLVIRFRVVGKAIESLTWELQTICENFLTSADFSAKF